MISAPPLPAPCRIIAHLSSRPAQLLEKGAGRGALKRLALDAPRGSILVLAALTRGKVRKACFQTAYALERLCVFPFQVFCSLFVCGSAEIEMLGDGVELRSMAVDRLWR